MQFSKFFYFYNIFLILWTLFYKFCKMVEMSNWIPNKGDTEWENNGKLLAETSLLGSFFKLSIFAEEDPRVVERYLKTDSELSVESLNLICKQLQPLLASTRVNLNFLKIKYFSIIKKI